jgi:hypothetical protein
MSSSLVGQGLGDLSTDRYCYYWPSTEEEDAKWAQSILMNNPQPSNSGTKSNFFRVRPIRSY